MIGLLMQMYRTIKVLNPRTSKGVTVIEYIVLVTLIIFAAIAAIKGLGTQIGNEFNDVNAIISNHTHP